MLQESHPLILKKIILEHFVFLTSPSSILMPNPSEDPKKLKIIK